MVLFSEHEMYTYVQWTCVIEEGSSRDRADTGPKDLKVSKKLYVSSGNRTGVETVLVLQHRRDNEPV